MKTGIDRLFDEHLFDFKNKKVALLLAAASINRESMSTLKIFLEQGVNLVCLFGPEHGVTGRAQDMEAVAGNTDQASNLPIISLYGNSEDSLKPRQKDLEGVDVLVCDLQDVGCRYYTYIYTIVFCMEALSRLGKKVLILDRPNPINGLAIDGPMLKPDYASFVGLFPIPTRHAMTIGELARYFNHTQKIACDLEVIPMQGWRREMYFDDTGLPWVPPSPNMKTLHTAILYPGMCLMEATGLSEGRGTEHPFELVGAPYVDARKLADEMQASGLTGVEFSPATFRPVFQKWAGQDCHGIKITVTNRKSFQAIRTGVAILQAVIKLHPHDFKWRKKPYEFVCDRPAVDLLWGDDSLRRQLTAGDALATITGDWEKGYGTFLAERKKYLLYAEADV